jgi:hypothetical protein
MGTQKGHIILVLGLNLALYPSEDQTCMIINKDIADTQTTDNFSRELHTFLLSALKNEPIKLKWF